MFESYRILPVVETQGAEFGDLTLQPFNTIVDAQRDCDSFNSRTTVAGLEGKRMIWTIYGVTPPEDGVSRNIAVYDCDSETGARSVLKLIIGTDYTVDNAGNIIPASSIQPIALARINDAIELLEAALSHIEHYRDSEEVDSLALADEAIEYAIRALKGK